MEIKFHQESLNEKAKISEWHKWWLLFLLLESNQVNHSHWDEFAQDIIYKNRFSSSSIVVKELIEQAKHVTHMVPQGTTFFRARRYKESPYKQFLAQWMRKNGVSDEKMENELKDIQPIAKMFFKTFFSESCYLADNEFPSTITCTPKEAVKEWKAQAFKGFDATDSGAPKNYDIISGGRANPDYIRYLYLAEDADTACYEIRPIIGQYISVATFKSLKQLKLYDLTSQRPNHFENPVYEAPSLFDCISEHFSMPNADDPRKYIPTQFLTEKIKELGFDGLRFRSSLKQGGINIVLFEPESCEAISSDLVEIKQIEMEICPFQILQVDASSQKTGGYYINPSQSLDNTVSPKISD